MIQNRHESSMLPISIATPFILSHLQFVSLAQVTTLVTLEKTENIRKRQTAST